MLLSLHIYFKLICCDEAYILYFSACVARGRYLRHIYVIYARLRQARRLVYMQHDRLSYNALIMRGHARCSIC